MSLTCCLKHGAVFPVCQMSPVHTMCRTSQHYLAKSTANKTRQFTLETLFKTKCCWSPVCITESW